MNWTVFFGSIWYAVIGIILFVLAYIIFDWIAPRLAITKPLIEDKNVGLGLVIAGMFIGIAIIIAAAIR